MKGAMRSGDRESGPEKPILIQVKNSAMGACQDRHQQGDRRATQGHEIGNAPQAP